MFTTTRSSDTQPKNTNTRIRQLHLCIRGEGIWTRRIRKDPRLTRMAAVHLPPLRQTGGGSSFTPPAVGSQPEVIEVDDNKAVLVITPALVYDMQGEVYVSPADIVQAVDDVKVPDGYRRDGSRERSFMYSPELYVVPSAEEDHKHKYFCMADLACRKTRRRFPDKGDRSNVNTRHISKRRLRGVAGAVKAGKQKRKRKGTSSGASRRARTPPELERTGACMSNRKLLFSNTYQTGLGKGVLKYTMYHNIISTARHSFLKPR